MGHIVADVEFDVHEPHLPVWRGGGCSAESLAARIDSVLPGLMERNGYGDPYPEAIYYPLPSAIIFIPRYKPLTPRQAFERNTDTSEGRNAAYREVPGQKRVLSGVSSDSQSDPERKHAEFATRGAEISTISPRMDSYTTQEEKRGISPDLEGEADLTYLAAHCPTQSGVDPVLWACYQFECHGVRRLHIQGEPKKAVKLFCRRKEIEICCE